MSAGIFFQSFDDKSFDKSFDADLDRPPGIQLLRNLPRFSPSLDCLDIGLGSIGVETVLEWSVADVRGRGCAELLLALGNLFGEAGRLAACSLARPCPFPFCDRSCASWSLSPLALDPADSGDGGDSATPLSWTCSGRGLRGRGLSNEDAPFWCFDKVGMLGLVWPSVMGSVDSGEPVRTKPKSTLECCEAGVAVPGAGLSEELSTVETEPFVSEAVLGLSSKEEDLWESSRAEGMGSVKTGASLDVRVEGNAPVEVLGRKGLFARRDDLFIEPIELVGEKKDVSTSNLDFLRFATPAPDSSCWSLDFVDSGSSCSLMGWPSDPS